MEIIFIGLMKSDRRLNAPRESSKWRKYGTSKTGRYTMFRPKSSRSHRASSSLLAYLEDLEDGSTCHRLGKCSKCSNKWGNPVSHSPVATSTWYLKTPTTYPTSTFWESAPQVTVWARVHLETIVIYQLGFSQNYCTFSSTSLINIVLCDKFPWTKFIDCKYFDMRWGV